MSARDDALEQAYIKWHLPLLRFLKRRLRSDAEAEDVTQESFTRWAESGARTVPADPQAYVTQIALNTVQANTRQEIMVPLDEGSPEQYGASPVEASCPLHMAETRQILERIEQALDEMPERQREAFTLHRFDGLSHDEIAQEMGISSRMVSKHISRAVAYCHLRTQYPSVEAMRADTQQKDVAHGA